MVSLSSCKGGGLKFPRFPFNPKARIFFKLWREQVRANTRLREELIEWQNKVLHQARVPLLFQPPPKPVESVRRPPIGLTDKRAYMAEQPNYNNSPTTEQILAAAEAAKHRNGN